MRAEFDVSLRLGDGDRILFWSGIGVAAGAILSGPVGFLVAMIDGQPPWIDAATFLDRHRWWHAAPYWFGFGFIAAWVALTARLAAIAPSARRTAGFSAMAGVAVYATLIALNYTLQIAWVPDLVRHGDPAAAYVTMANPSSIGWVIEMFGYGALGASNLAAARLIPTDAGRLRSWIVWLLIANGIVSIASAAAVAVDTDWLMAPAGLAAFLVWNILAIAIGAVTAAGFRPR